MENTHLPTPSRLRRFVCMVYEGMLLFGLVFLAGFLFDIVTDSRHALKLRALRQAFLFIVISIYFLSAWLKSGQTLAMKTWHIRLLSATGTRPSAVRLLRRYVLMWVFPLITAMIIELAARSSQIPALSLLIVFAPFSNFIYTWLDSNQQFMHDRMCHTRLVHQP